MRDRVGGHFTFGAKVRSGEADPMSVAIEPGAIARPQLGERRPVVLGQVRLSLVNPRRCAQELGLSGHTSLTVSFNSRKVESGLASRRRTIKSIVSSSITRVLPPRQG